MEILRLPGDLLTYEYDYGDGWEHEVLLKAVMLAEPGQKHPFCAAGARACPTVDGDLNPRVSGG